MGRALLLTFALIVTSMTGPLPSQVHAADASSDIPGVALPGSRTTSEVGGALFDRVWSIELSEGKVAIFRISGESGAELGLYLFNGFAQSVYSSEPIATSARPGAAQEIAVALPAGRYFVNVNGRNADRAYQFTLTTALYSDPTPPTIGARFAGGRNRFSTPYVEIEPRAYDTLSGVAYIRYGVDDSDWSPWLPYSGGTIRVPVLAAEKTLRIRIQARNGVELLSNIATLNATIDLTSPSFQVVGDLSRQVTYSTRPKLIYLFNEPMNARSVAESVVLRDLSGALLPTSCVYDQSSRSATCVPVEELAYGRAYLVAFQGASDVAGNSAIDTNPLTLSVQRRTSISFAKTSISVRFGEPIGIRIVTQGIPTGTTLTLESRVSTDNEWVAAGIMRVNRIGEATKFISPVRSVDYRVRYQGDLERALSESAPLRINVIPNIQLASPRADAIVRAPGDEIALKGSVAPTHATASLLIFKCNAGYLSCTLAQSVPVMADSLGLVSRLWTARRGFWKIRLVTSAGDGLLRAISRTIRITVR